MRQSRLKWGNGDVGQQQIHANTPIRYIYFIRCTLVALSCFLKPPLGSLPSPAICHISAETESHLAFCVFLAFPLLFPRYLMKQSWQREAVVGKRRWQSDRHSPLTAFRSICGYKFAGRAVLTHRGCWRGGNWGNNCERRFLLGIEATVNSCHPPWIMQLCRLILICAA